MRTGMSHQTVSVDSRGICFGGRSQSDWPSHRSSIPCQRMTERPLAFVRGQKTPRDNEAKMPVKEVTPQTKQSGARNTRKAATGKYSADDKSSQGRVTEAIGKRNGQREQGRSGFRH